MKKIVKLSNGKYAIAKYWNILGFKFNYRFKDLESLCTFWWRKNSQHFGDCLGTLSQCKKEFYKMDNNLLIEKEIEYNCSNEQT